MNTMFLCKKVVLTLVLVVGLLASLTSCATDGAIDRAQTGAAVGAVAGAVLGHQLDSDAGRYVGALAGALAGGVAGSYMDRQQRELEAQLEAERMADQIQITRLQNNSLKLDVSSEVSFDIDSARIKPGFYASLDKIATVFDNYPHTVVHVVGFTDSTGSEDYNQQLSVNRATSVERYLLRQGIDNRRVRADGRGENSPVASNATAKGRSQNRRVEIVLKPIVEAEEELAFSPQV